MDNTIEGDTKTDLDNPEADALLLEQLYLNTEEYALLDDSESLSQEYNLIELEIPASEDILEDTIPVDETDEGEWAAVRKDDGFGEYTELVKKLPDGSEIYKPATCTLRDNDSLYTDESGKQIKGHGHRNEETGYDRLPIADPVKAPGVSFSEPLQR